MELNKDAPSNVKLNDSNAINDPEELRLFRGLSIDETDFETQKRF